MKLRENRSLRGRVPRHLTCSARHQRIKAKAMGCAHTKGAPRFEAGKCLPWAGIQNIQVAPTGSCRKDHAADGGPRPEASWSGLRDQRPLSR